MLDIRFIRENAHLVQECAKEKGYDVNVGELLKKNETRDKRLKEREDLKRESNDLSKTGPPKPEELAHAKETKQKLERAREEFRKIDNELNSPNGLNREVPNFFPKDTPLGGEEANREERKWGETRDKDFEILDHLDWGEKNDLIDFERGAKVAGNKFYYLKGSLVELELAVFQMGMELAKKHGFMPMTVPHLVNNRIIEGTGFSAKGDEKQIYAVEGGLNLIATAEIPMTGYHADEVVNGLPILYAGLSPAYRFEAGAYGRHSRGLYRTHQFNKLELYVFCEPKDSEEWHQKMVAMEEEMCQKLEIPYRLVRIAAGDLGAPAYKKFDIEYWSPCDKQYHELMSCSNVTDYQARRLKIRYKDKTGQTAYVHSLNGTLAAMSRITIALIENFQTKDGSVKIPGALQIYMGGQLTL